MNVATLTAIIRKNPQQATRYRSLDRIAGMRRRHANVIRRIVSDCHKECSKVQPRALIQSLVNISKRLFMIHLLPVFPDTFLFQTTLLWMTLYFPEHSSPAASPSLEKPS